MPTYQYTCTACGADLEAVQKFTDEPLATCPQCEGKLRKVYSAVGVVFKGSGFYRNDSRSGSSTSASSASGSANTKSTEGEAKDSGAATSTTSTTGDSAKGASEGAAAPASSADSAKAPAAAAGT